MKEKLKQIPLLGPLVDALELIKLPGGNGFSFYDLIQMYLLGIVRGAFTARAGSVSFSFFMALFPFLLFVLNLIPFIPIANFDSVLLEFIEALLPQDTHVFFTSIFHDIQSKPRGGLLSSVFVLSVFLTANGVSAIFGSFEESYHVKLTRNFFRQYLIAIGVSVLLAFLLLLAVAVFVFFELYFLRNLSDYIPGTFNWIRTGQLFFFVVLAYFSISTLYFFGTVEGKITRFFSPGAFLTTLLLIASTYLFGIYVDRFSNYNQLYGSIGALLLFMLYTWINSILLLLGFELNATLTRLNKRSNLKNSEK
ncbi:YihY/virulence factor BrkB family protein [Candidatus Arcticimaribacter forsetii]|uniref:YihY/virulence factor BrkB family protein n=1 Tax=Candidatus Arcticimaribacter forsetii TaxID=2820661 RepID=UPI002076F24A|nr:YihY/virulence factor BrkB family protein [Candidatus Arcticimaribacter forsetii]MDB2325548.1 YihY/virulence factor BrkB family protein [Flavobacteriaceae bacterium]MDB2329918.1 YihY/virulence factor BrkB family protein [Flavobacteriaceae bacterium]MDB4643669.1 YihY/virulence factor BrkB family protein [Flavobacteriaceae bacterium]MDB4715355.1 YihY/virulence factor BrkB family protein [Flavobacteriaceae bacterium]